MIPTNTDSLPHNALLDISVPIPFIIPHAVSFILSLYGVLANHSKVYCMARPLFFYVNSKFPTFNQLIHFREPLPNPNYLMHLHNIGSAYAYNQNILRVFHAIISIFFAIQIGHVVYYCVNSSWVQLDDSAVSTCTNDVGDFQSYLGWMNVVYHVLVNLILLYMFAGRLWYVFAVHELSHFCEFHRDFNLGFDSFSVLYPHSRDY